MFYLKMINKLHLKTLQLSKNQSFKTVLNKSNPFIFIDVEIEKNLDMSKLEI